MMDELLKRSHISKSGLFSIHMLNCFITTSNLLNSSIPVEIRECCAGNFQIITSQKEEETTTNQR